MKKLIIMLLSIVCLTALALSSTAQAATKIAWDAPTSGGTVKNYTVYLSDGTTTYYYTVDATVTSVLITELNLTPGTWTVWVTASNEVGESEVSNTITYDVEIYVPPQTTLPAATAKPGAVTVKIVAD